MRSRLMVLLIAVLGGVTGGGIAGGLIAGDLPPGSLAQWVGGVGTVGALLFAGRQLQLDLEERRHREEERRERNEIEALTDARAIRLDSKVSHGTRAPSANEIGPQEYSRGSVTLANDSRRTIRDVIVGYRRGDWTTEESSNEVRPDQSIRVSVTKSWPRAEAPAGGASCYGTWSDLDGRRWQLSDTGGLEPL